MLDTDYVLKDFKITASVMKAYESVDIFSDKPTRRYIIGKASGTMVDREGERMAQSAIDAFQKAINTGITTHTGEWSLVPLVSTHDTNGVGASEWDKVIGFITKAWVDDAYDLWIEAELDEDNPSADMLYRKLTRVPEHGRPVQLGLSIGGRVLSADSEWDPTLGRSIYTYKDVALRHVTITSAPAYPTEYLTALSKSVDWNKVHDAQDPLIVSKETVSHMEDLMENTEQIVDKTEETAEAIEEVAKTEDVVEVAEAVEKTEEVEAVADAVEKAEAVVEEVVEVEKSETEVLAERVEVLTQNMLELTKAVEKFLTPAQVDEAVQEVAAKSEVVEEAVEEVAKEEVVEEVAEEVAKTETVDVEALLTKSVDLFASKMTETINPLLTPLIERINALEEQEVDKSISVSRASDITKGMLEEDSDAAYHERLKQARGSDAIRAIFQD